MKKIFLPIIGLGAILFAMTLNLNYAANDYGILENTLSFHVTAQASTSGNGGSNSEGNGSGSSDSSNSGSACTKCVDCSNDCTCACHKTQVIIRKPVNIDCTVSMQVYNKEKDKYEIVSKAGKRMWCVGELGPCSSNVCTPIY